eukprot:TRINITY_DN59367_c0_g1_i1.p1 TRINITY_DN59367_c0_g1~~TRINITY_DN59367_c0_g1_i1.p1  ORF type:complete len:561 (+),score=116.62 TRINITY_DN59367_c0_g1_i1:70-1752(+)
MPKKPGGAASSSPGYEERLRSAEDLEQVLTILDEVEASDGEHGKGFFFLALNALAQKAQGGASQATSKPAAVKRGEWLLESSAKLDGGKPQESAVTSMVRICCACGAQERAMQLVAEARAKGVKPRLRTLSAVLLQASEAGDRDTCDKLWAQLPSLGLEPQDAEFAIMLRTFRGDAQRQYAILRQILEELPTPSDPPLVEEIGRVFGVESGVAALRSAQPPRTAGREDSAGRVWHLGWTTVDEEGTCALSGQRLRALDVTTEEEVALERMVARLADDTGGRSKPFRRFRRWLEERPPFDMVVDGANVGFNNQNREGGLFQYSQIDAVVRKLRETGHRVLLVLHPKWLREDADRTVTKKKKRKLDQISVDGPMDSPVEEEETEEDDAGEDIIYPHDPVTPAEREAPKNSPLGYIRSWKESECLVRVPAKDCDDWYWLFAALSCSRRGARHVQVVSNDHMRDHHWRMLGNRSFLRWQSRHMTRVNVWFEASPDPENCKVTLTPPAPYSLEAQEAPDGEAWHFPVPAVPSRAEQLSSGRPLPRKEIEAAECHWLVAWREPVRP